MRAPGRPIDVPVAVATWVVAFVFGQLVSAAILATSGAETTDEVPIPTLFAAVLATWVAYLAGCYVASKRSGSGDPVEDYAIRFRAVDVVGLPIGVLTQLVLVPARVRPAAGHLARHVLRGQALRDGREARRPGQRRDDGAARA